MNLAFDTLSASKRLRDAGVEERAADAIVELVQSAAHFPDISGLATKTDTATKADIGGLATKADIVDMVRKADIADMVRKADIVDMVRKADIADMATKADIANMATKAELADLAHSTKIDIQALKADLAITKNQILAELNDKLRLQSFALMGGVTAIVGLATAILKLGS
ncbi:MAG TPA: hypothetical protein VN157_00360 [Caulobacter sp.]|nr:hypothetical protein [Caulobacter sp.]